MRCPKCDEGTIINVRLKKKNEIAFLCDFCDALWLEGEEISFHTGHALGSFAGEEEREYTLEEHRAEDQEHEPAAYTDYK